MFFRRIAKSGWLTPALVGLLCAGLLTGSAIHGRGKLRRLDAVVTRVVDPSAQYLVTGNSGPGGQAPIRLSRTATSIGKEVELISATLLPGHGMNVFQLTAIVPGHGEVQLLDSPNLESATSMLNGSGEDMHGERSMSMGGAILLPFAGHLTGRPGAQPGLLDAVWQGQTLHFPALVEGGTSSVDGLFLDRASSSARSDVLPDGQFAQAVYRSAFAEGWPSTIEVTVTAELSAHTLDLTLTAVNKGKDPAPMGMGWHPVFQIPSGHRADAMLRIPSRTVIAIDRSTGLPTGKTVSTGGSGTDLSRAGGVRLGSQDIDATFTQLETDAVSPYPVAELLDPEYNLSLRVVPMTANLSHLYVSAPATRKSVSIGPASNVPDAFGPEWTPQQSGMIQLAPGATAQWKIRIEVSSIVSGEDRVR